MFMLALRMDRQAKREEDRLLQIALEESKQMISDPNSPDVDNMTYEQLLEMQDAAGKVSRGLSKSEIDAIKAFMWIDGRTQSDSCTICMEKYEVGVKFKRLGCKHEYHSECLNEWLKNSKKCPVCSQDVTEGK